MGREGSIQSQSKSDCVLRSFCIKKIKKKHTAFYVSIRDSLTVICCPDAMCQSPFVEVGGRCLHLDYSVSGTWAQMRQYCQAIGGDLVNLSDVQFYEDVLLYMRSLGKL